MWTLRCAKLPKKDKNPIFGLADVSNALKMSKIQNLASRMGLIPYIYIYIYDRVNLVCMTWMSGSTDTAPLNSEIVK